MEDISVVPIEIIYVPSKGSKHQQSLKADVAPRDEHYADVATSGSLCIESILGPLKLHMMRMRKCDRHVEELISQCGLQNSTYNNNNTYTISHTIKVLRPKSNSYNRSK